MKLPTLDRVSATLGAVLILLAITGGYLLAVHGALAVFQFATRNHLTWVVLVLWWAFMLAGILFGGPPKPATPGSR